MQKIGYVTTGRDLPHKGNATDVSCWFLSGKVQEAFGDIPVVISSIHEEVTGPEGLTLEETIQLLRLCRTKGYFRTELVSI